MDDVRLLPAQAVRVETGPVQFGDDWPGVFIRGDWAGYWAMTLLQHLNTGGNAITESTLRGMAATLVGCIEGPSGDILRKQMSEGAVRD